ncbi:helix-turn-helix domain-containing protein [Planctomicrobium sp. SH661]|uniref:helix-turn-helix domain-containing protein n=1 Tax=Planctomicrobium sp. SH661 TaxID=3448124 RepID=UPI003F5C1C67
MSRSAEEVKIEALRKWGALHASPEDVADELFLAHEFFDPRDLVQVKYEMLRRVQLEGLSVSEAARRFGFSRTAFYQALALFEQQGLPGLIPHRPGPKGAHKLNQDVVEFLQQQQARNAALRAGEMVELVQREFDISVHPRSIERALLRERKKGHSTEPEGR